MTAGSIRRGDRVFLLLIVFALAACTKLDPLSPGPAVDVRPSTPWPLPFLP